MNGDSDKYESGFTVTGYCPNDPSDVKCCLSKSCTDTSGSGGLCLNTGTGCSGSFVTNRCPGPGDVQCCVGGEADADDDELKVVFWINSFIPRDIDGVSKPVPNNNEGETMIVGLTEALEDVLALGGCFATDQRPFSTDQHASSRMHSETTVRIDSGDYDWTQAHHIDPTHKVDCDDGELKDERLADINDMNFDLVSGSSSKVVLSYVGSAGNPFDALAPHIDLKGTLTVDRVGKTVMFDGAVDDFPAFEAYAVLNGFGPYKVATLGPDEGATAADLLGGANRAFSGKLYV